ncbi:small peptidoglycan-associated lipoprotein [Cytobacillus sp. FJAT-54145]|uniref:Small peptidoglycan-associated lipoprotein n=1 Tax=Cytobacillus spartinae TaxID=3299023 RepID=A0ABW6KHN1_9BACI
MRRIPLILIVSLLVITTSCKSKGSELGGELNIDDSIKQVIFFSDETEYQYEASYYDAIIELKKEFPEEMKNMKILPPTEAKRYYSTFKVKECPAIFVLYNEQIVAQVHGESSKEQIIQPIAKALSTGL